MNFLRSTFDSIKSKVKDLRDGHRSSQIADEWLRNQIPDVTEEQKYYLADRSSVESDIRSLMEHMFVKLGSKSSKKRQILNALQMADFLLKNGSKRIMDEVKDEIYVLKTFKSFHSAEGGEEMLDECIRSVAGKICDSIENKEMLIDQRVEADRLRKRFGWGVRKEVADSGPDLEMLEKEIQEEIMTREIEQCADKGEAIDPRFTGYSNEDYERERTQAKLETGGSSPEFVGSFKKGDKQVEREIRDKWREFDEREQEEDEEKDEMISQVKSNKERNVKRSENGNRPRRLKKLPKAPKKKNSRLAQRLGIKVAPKQASVAKKQDYEKIDEALDTKHANENDDLHMIDFLGGPSIDPNPKHQQNTNLVDDMIDFGLPVTTPIIPSQVPSSSQNGYHQSSNNDGMLDFGLSYSNNKNNGNSRNIADNGDLNLLDFQAPHKPQNRNNNMRGDDIDLLVGPSSSNGYSQKKTNNAPKLGQNSMFSDIKADLFDLSGMGQALPANTSTAHNPHYKAHGNQNGQFRVGNGLGGYTQTTNRNLHKPAKTTSGITFDEFDLI